MTAAHDQTVDLLQRWHAGDRNALLELVERDRAWVEDCLRRRRGRLLRRHAETVDDFQDLMVQALEYAPRFVAANRRQFRGLVVRMLGNQLVDKARRLERRDEVESLGAESRLSLDPTIARATPPDAAAARNEEIAWMRLGLEFLPAEDRHLIHARQFEERSFKDIAAAEGLEPDAVRMRFNRSLLRLAGIVERLQRGEVDRLLEESGDADAP